MGFLQGILEQEFLRYALLGGVLASIGCGLVGPYVVVKRIGYIAGGIAHAILGAMGLAYYLGQDPLIGALAGSIAVALLIGWVSLRWREQEDMLIAALWASGMAAGVLFLSQTPGYSIDLMSYLFGNILLLSPRELWLMAALDVALGVLVVVFYRQFLAVCFDEEFARLRGVRVTFFYLLLLCMVSLTVVLLIQVVGLILVIALISLPAALAGQWVSSLGRMMLLATIIGLGVTTGGLWLAYAPDLPAGAVIVLLATGIYIASTVVRGVLRR